MQTSLGCQPLSYDEMADVVMFLDEWAVGEGELEEFTGTLRMFLRWFISDTGGGGGVRFANGMACACAS